MTLRARRNAALSGAIAVAVAALFFADRPARAQGMVRPNTDGEFHFTTNIGSFKLLGTEDKDVTGHLEVSAKGTILVSGVDQPPVTTGTLRLEYSYLPLKKFA